MIPQDLGSIHHVLRGQLIVYRIVGPYRADCCTASISLTPTKENHKRRPQMRSQCADLSLAQSLEPVDGCIYRKGSVIIDGGMLKGTTFVGRGTEILTC